jgi:glutamine synthetase
MGMDTSISLDISVFREAEREAEHLRVTLPELCTMAIQEFVKNKHKSEITEQINSVYAAYKAEIGEDILQAQYDILPEEDW